MVSENVLKLLRELDAQLASLTRLEPEARPSADAVARQLARLGAQPATGAHGLEALAVRFEAEHPAAAATLRQLADQLGKAGI